MHLGSMLQGALCFLAGAACTWYVDKGGHACVAQQPSSHAAAQPQPEVPAAKTARPAAARGGGGTGTAAVSAGAPRPAISPLAAPAGGKETTPVKLPANVGRSCGAPPDGANAPPCDPATARQTSAICLHGPQMPGTIQSIAIMLERNPGVHMVWVSIAGGNHGSYLEGAIGKNCDNCASAAMAFKFNTAEAGAIEKLQARFPGRLHYITEVPKEINGKGLNAGHKNRNNHRVSAYYSVWYAKNVLKRTWAIKLRSDHLLRRADFLVWFCALQRLFPLGKGAYNQTVRPPRPLKPDIP